MKKSVQNRGVGVLLIILLGIQLSFTSCGTLMHPERKGQTGGRIDPGVAVLDGVGLLFFIIPGLIAYGVDFSNGTIYLPGTSSRNEVPERREMDAVDGEQMEVVVVQGSPGGPTRAEMERIMEEETGRRVSLEGYPGRAIALSGPEEFPSAYREQVEAGVIPRGR